MRALLDTNIFVSYLLNSGKNTSIEEVFNALEKNSFTLLTPEALFEEIEGVCLHKKSLTSRIKKSKIKEFFTILRNISEEIPMIEEEIPAICRDPKDDYLLAYAVVGRADYLVTGDKDLLDLKIIQGVRIVTVGEFLKVLSL